MKKVFLLAMTALAMTFASCGNKANPSANGTDTPTDTVAVLSKATEQTADSLTTALSSQLTSKDAKTMTATLAGLQVKYAELVKAGKLEEAKGYAVKIQAFLNQHAEEIQNVAAGNTTIASLVEGIKNLPTKATTTAEEAAAAVKSDVQTLATTAADKAVTDVKAATVDKANEAVNKANDAVNNAKKEAEAKANEKVNNAKKKANDAVNKAANKANDAVNKAADKAIKGLGL
ncbi:MAG: hypothetical protein LKE41_12805 [Prevotella sp.]|jgi:hypothetical protein|nr:hypothetical protein [Prevotella sp.]MCI2080432.1 hypothetical protein [Prevotella sp.]MCI2102256.1 hypothetical protein [Prevotella sp.]